MKIYNSKTGKVRKKRKRIDPVENRLKKAKEKLSYWEKLQFAWKMQEKYNFQNT